MCQSRRRKSPQTKKPPDGVAGRLSGPLRGTARPVLLLPSAGLLLAAFLLASLLRSTLRCFLLSACCHRNSSFSISAFRFSSDGRVEHEALQDAQLVKSILSRQRGSQQKRARIRTSPPALECSRHQRSPRARSSHTSITTIHFSASTDFTPSRAISDVNNSPF